MTDTAKPKRPVPDRAESDSRVAQTRALIERTNAGIRSTDEYVDRSEDTILAAKKLLKRPAGKLGAEKLTPEEQHQRFVEAARAAGASEDEADFNAIIRQIAKPKAKQA